MRAASITFMINIQGRFPLSISSNNPYSAAARTIRITAIMSPVFWADFSLSCSTESSISKVSGKADTGQGYLLSG